MTSPDLEKLKIRLLAVSQSADPSRLAQDCFYALHVMDRDLEKLKARLREDNGWVSNLSGDTLAAIIELEATARDLITAREDAEEQAALIGEERIFAQRAIEQANSRAEAAEKRVAEMREALQPFADYSDRKSLIPDDHIITQGSYMAKRQLTMGDCRKAAEAIASMGEKDASV